MLTVTPDLTPARVAEHAEELLRELAERASAPERAERLASALARLTEYARSGAGYGSPLLVEADVQAALAVLFDRAAHREPGPIAVRLADPGAPYGVAIRAALARAALDSGRLPAPEHLAALVGLSGHRIRGLLRTKELPATPAALRAWCAARGVAGFSRAEAPGA